MRSLLLLITVLCLSALSFGAAANTHAGMPGPAFDPAFDPARAELLIAEPAFSRTLDELDGGAGLERVVAPGDDGLAGEAMAAAAEEDDPPGYCEIWSADLLDPLDMLDEIEESSALFALPTVRVSLPPNEIAQQLPARPDPLPAAFFKPPISLI
ncbi:cobalt-zinc-cadmium resistance protein [Cupriavidus sp. UME77]|uniref:cobalt-zinc-cadmium resistance protein n=1 Tax=Cupriavidus sp. UME77 TaxID=1862321 RepID=UPI0016029827|nr:cobalt-zinc-cadmium resistance protein [Cupriavidus sp. UME77]MBB1634370.1 cobalt-zinc-cadmium resistance protein [Cupriavidus sp. UME77]